jgi:AcrR family transcriptional regulator
VTSRQRPTEQPSGNDHEAAGGKPMRADARRNRARVLEVAEEVFATKGTSASTEEIAKAAGVGVGTVFRHFPTKESLLEAVFVRRMRRLADEADALSTADDPGTAFFSFFARVVEQSATKNAFGDALAEAGVDVRAVASGVGVDFRAAIGALLDRAQRAGAVRDDVAIPEVLIILLGASRAAEAAGGKDPALRDKALAVVLDGLRPR